jgi:uncharacterized protein (TIGR02145 family)
MKKLIVLFVYAFTVCMLLGGCDEDVTDGIEGTVTDIDGNEYRTITIGEQEWMAENLRTTHYSNGTPILNISDMDEWEENVSTGAWGYYDNDESNDAVYGKLYNWFAATDSQGLCPQDWHVPDGDDWEALTEYLGGSDTAGCSMKEEGTSHWDSPNTCADNRSGFTGLPGGYRDPSGFVNLGRHGGWWSTEEDNAERGWFHIINYNDSNLYRLFMFKKNEVSIRCVRD